jgi:cell division protein FtsB
MSGWLDRRKQVLQRWPVVVVLLVIVPVAIGFNARLATVRQMRQDEARLRQAVATEQLKQTDLQALRGYVASDAYVEHWARAEARMTRPGEVAVIPVAPTSSQINSPEPAPANAPGSILEEWWSVFFDDGSPTP